MPTKKNNKQVTLDNAIENAKTAKVNLPTSDDIAANLASESNRAAAVVASIAVKQAFELYSWRVIDHNAFVDRMKDIMKDFENDLK
jgi:hypothetical protein